MPAKGSMRRRVKPAFLTKFYPKYVKETKRKDRKRFMLIYKALFQQIADWMLEDPEGFKLPFNMGILIIMRYTPKAKPVNIRQSVRAGKVIYYQNLHSFGDAITVTWIKPEYVKYRNMEAYYFQSERKLQRRASHACLAGKIYKKIESRDQYAREMIALDNIQERYDEKIHKQTM
jgi:hypothetical protein